MKVKDLIKALNKDHVDQESDLIYVVETKDTRHHGAGHWDIRYEAIKEDDKIVYTGSVTISCQLDDEDLEDLTEKPMTEKDWG